MSRERSAAGQVTTGAVTTADASRAPSGRPDAKRVRRLALALAAWSLAYAGYRAYYALGGHVGMIGRPVSQAEFERVNAVGAGAILLLAAVMPVVLAWVPRLWPVLPVVGWLGAVGCCMHALVDVTLRLFSVTGVRPVELPASFWASVDQRRADLQDLLLNEPWFFVTGLLWAGPALAVLPERHARRWVTSATAACLLLSVYGVLRGLDVLGPTPLG